MKERDNRLLGYLPGIYHEDPTLGDFLEPFADVVVGIEALLAEIDRYSAPAFTDALADSDFLPWLATWVDLLLDPEWDEAKRRRLIDEAVELYRWRGTVRGLKRYLEIYTGHQPEIREGRWPGGMQIGVASRIGGLVSSDDPVPTTINSFTRRTPVVSHDYYVVNTIAPLGHPVLAAGEPLEVYYRTDGVESVSRNADGSVSLRLKGGTEKTWPAATVARRDGLIDDRYTLRIPVNEEEETGEEYFGDTALFDEEEMPYRFIVDVKVPAEEAASVDLAKVRAIVGLEKPAHTLYSLKLTPIPSSPLETMLLEVRSTVAVDTIIA